jgi:peptide/nickel transport system permease protein
MTAIDSLEALAEQKQTGKVSPPPKQSGFRLPSLPKSGLLRLGVAMLIMFTCMAIFGPMIFKNPNAFSNDSLQGPSLHYWLGTTLTGQDVFQQLIVGSRITMIVGFTAGLIATTLSVIIGLTTGYMGGWWDDVLSLVTNVFLVIPGTPLAIIVTAILPERSIVPVILIISFTNWAWGARVLRSQILTMRSRDFVQACKVSGESDLRIMFVEVLPNLAAIVASSFISTTVYAILTEIALEYLGLSNTLLVSWGNMLYWAENSGTLLTAWWWFMPPGICIALLGASLTFINFGLDTLSNPRLRAVPTTQKTPQKKGAQA